MNRERAFAAAIRIAAESRPDCFSIKEGDICFLDWSIPAWLLLAAHGPTLEKLRDDLTVGDVEPMNDERALLELQAAQRVINHYIAENFVTDFCMDEKGLFGFSYDPQCFADRAQRAIDDAA